MHRPTVSKTFDGGDLVVFVHHGKRKTRIDASPFDVHGTGAELAEVTSFFGSRHPKLLSEHIEQSRASIHRELMCSAVDLQANRFSSRWQTAFSTDLRNCGVRDSNRCTGGCGNFQEVSTTPFSRTHAFCSSRSAFIN